MTSEQALAADLYAVVVYLHKNCNSDLFEAVGALELSLTQIKLLHHLEVEERLRRGDPVELAHPVRHVEERAPVVADELDEEVVLTGRDDDVDRRMKRVRLTDSGRSVIRRLNAARLSGLEKFTQDLTEGERSALAQGLERLLARPDVAECRPEAAQ